jgi:transcription antitermination factor NusG
MPIEEGPGTEVSVGDGTDPIALDSMVLIINGPFIGNRGQLVDYTRRRARGVVSIDGTEHLIPVSMLQAA